MVEHIKAAVQEMDEALLNLIRLGLVEPVRLETGESGYRLKTRPVDS